MKTNIANVTIPTPLDVKDYLIGLPAILSSKAQAIVDYAQGHPQLFTLVVLLAFIPAIFWLWLFAKKGPIDTAHNRFMGLTFAIGMLSVLPVFLIDDVLASLFHINLHTIFASTSHETLGRILYFIVAVGMLEEYSKHLVVKEVDYRRAFFTRIIDGIEFSVAAALGFAFIENILYFLQAWNEVTRMQFAGVVLVRSLGSMLAHVLFSGIFGYYYGRAKFIEDEPRIQRKRRFHLNFLLGMQMRLARVKHMLSGSHLLVEIGHTLRRDQLIAEGLFIAMTLHGLYNWLLDINKVAFIVPLIFLEFVFIWHELEVSENLRIHGGALVPAPVRRSRSR